MYSSARKTQDAFLIQDNGSTNYNILQHIRLDKVHLPSPASLCSQPRPHWAHSEARSQSNAKRTTAATLSLQPLAR
jgi:hypothetical protein